jgi:hypothetical protein
MTLARAEMACRLGKVAATPRQACAQEMSLGTLRACPQVLEEKVTRPAVILLFQSFSGRVQAIFRQEIGTPAGGGNGEKSQHQSQQQNQSIALLAQNLEQALAVLHFHKAPCLPRRTPAVRHIELNTALVVC